MSYRVKILPLGDTRRAEEILNTMLNDGFSVSWVFPKDALNAVVIATDNPASQLQAAVQKKVKKTDNGE